MRGVSTLPRNRILHHDLSVSLVPEKSFLAAKDRLNIAGGAGDVDLLLYLGNHFALTGAWQDGHRLGIEVVEERRRSRRHRLIGWDSSGPPVEVRWEGTYDSFEGSKVCIISSQLIELSSFGYWFPSVSPYSEYESFTYGLEVDLQPDWDLVTVGTSEHGDVKRRSYRRQRPIGDIFLCAVPRFDCTLDQGDGGVTRVYSVGLDEKTRHAVSYDYRRCITLMARHFGPMLPGRGGVVVISPRGAEGEQWGFERGDLWVIGDLFAQEIVETNWRPPYSTGPMSLSLHETIHSWFGLGLEFNDPWLVEAITQYLQVVLGEELFQQPGLAEACFDSYVPRVLTKLEKDDRAISALTWLDNPYEQWYLKGSWALWDLEAATGRGPVLAALASIYRRHAGERIAYAEFEVELDGFLGTAAAVKGHLRHWFGGNGFAPLVRRDVASDTLPEAKAGDRSGASG